MFISFILSITGRTPPTFRDVFMLYCGLSPGATVRDLCTRYNPASLRVDERYCGKKSGVIIHRVLISTVDLCSFNFFAAFVYGIYTHMTNSFCFLDQFSFNPRVHLYLQAVNSVWDANRDYSSPS